MLTIGSKGVKSYHCAAKGILKNISNGSRSGELTVEGHKGNISIDFFTIFTINGTVNFLSEGKKIPAEN